MAEAVLEAHSQMGRVFFCCRQVGRPHCFYGHANFKYQSDADFNMKMCCNLRQLLAAHFLEKLIVDHRIDAIVVADAELKAVIEGHFLVSSHQRLLHLRSETCGVHCRLEVREKATLSRLFGRLLGRD